jgi:hypothetical protein
MLEHLYIQEKLREIDDARLRQRLRLLAELQTLERPRTRQRKLRRLVGPRLRAVGTWLERIGTTMAAEPQAREQA